MVSFFCDFCLVTKRYAYNVGKMWNARVVSIAQQYIAIAVPVCMLVFVVKYYRYRRNARRGSKIGNIDTRQSPNPTRPDPTRPTYQLHRFISRQFMISNILNFSTRSSRSLVNFRQLVPLLQCIYDAHRVMHRPTISYSAINEFICTSISMLNVYKAILNDFVSGVGQNCVSGRIRMKFIKTNIFISSKQKADCITRGF